MDEKTINARNMGDIAGTKNGLSKYATAHLSQAVANALLKDGNAVEANLNKIFSNEKIHEEEIIGTEATPKAKEEKDTTSTLPTGVEPSVVWNEEKIDEATQVVDEVNRNIDKSNAALDDITRDVIDKKSQDIALKFKDLVEIILRTEPATLSEEYQFAFTKLKQKVTEMNQRLEEQKEKERQANAPLQAEGHENPGEKGL